MRRHARTHSQPGNEPHESEDEMDGEGHPNMRRQARRHLQSGNEVREIEDERESEGGSPQP
jgi:hypothetical protein